MIDWNKSAELNNMGISECITYFSIYPRSSKKIVAICDNPECGKERKIQKLGYHPLCQSCSNKKAYINDPTLSTRVGMAVKTRFKDMDERKKTGDKMRGGMDIVNHHYLYDHDDLSKNTVEMTRSDHTRLHWVLKKLDIEIPHINRGI